MSMYVLYDPDTGEIDSLFSGTEEAAAMQGWAFLPNTVDAGDTTHYVDVSNTPHQIKPKGALEYLMDTAGLEVIFSGLPSGTVIDFEGVQLTAEGVEDSLVFDRPGTYLISLFGPVEVQDDFLEVSVG